MITEDKDKQSYPTRRELPLLPLRGMIVFPYMVVPLDVGREKSVSALEEAMVNDRLIALASQYQAKINEPTPDDIYRVGTLAEIKQLIKLPDGTIRVLVEGLSRLNILKFIQVDPHLRVVVEDVVEPQEKNSEIEALMRTTLFQFEQYIKLSKRVPPEVLSSVTSIQEAGRLADVIASHLNLKVEEKQGILEAIPSQERLEKLCALLIREMEILDMERKIHVRVRKQMEKTQKEYYLKEQIKAIQKELGEKDERVAECEELREKLSKLELADEVLDKANREIDRLEKMPPLAAEAVVVRNYLDWLLAMPWNISTEDRIDIKRAQEILDEDHYGLEQVKERILEYLAVCQLTNQIKGPIICLVGPPGVGKTSLARSVARALNRKFVRFSLGGVRDEAEIRGHRRTYIGAMPGKIVQAIRQAGSKNPVLLLDEIDKMSMDFRGDPSSALLEVLDPEQNNAFSDHYLEVPFDLSKVLFITTANTFHGIPRPLLDRMEVITISGYTEEEKVEIARRHLYPKQLKEHGIQREQLVLPEKVLRDIIRLYTKESGVRNLERQLAAICRKSARELVGGKSKTVRVTGQNLRKFLGVPKYRYGMAEEEDRIGVATGLAWTEVGGDLLSIEVTVVKGKGNLILTGKLGEVMRESAQAGVSYIRSRAKDLGIEEEFYEKFDLHIHVPEGAIPKDGPSAGITMATAVISALTNRPVHKDVAMTGEITLRGRVLPIGGLKEKVLAAHRAGIQRIIIPRENEKDLEEIPPQVARKLRFILVDTMDEVLNEALAQAVPAVSVG
ncbi:MAG TPA: endopeptidase La [Firmicutes bacterium]|jgi:ATP-dependent Lon protease|nr:endopeptidase La [Bacillota bacterium]HOQ23819.1 endopeptidase La [Bacillota bacterium]HPT66549.1 endopeptidase La [Bacillota bacterium]